jgi:anti-sigma regulatory factor (Ser/Thr protein kinase)
MRTMQALNAGGERGGFSHDARLFCDSERLTHGVCGFVEEGLAAGEPGLVIVPDWRLDAVRGGLGTAAERVGFENMTELGLNPARIIPALLGWVEGHRSPVRIVTEPVWAERSDAELVEVLRHEALVDSALAVTPARVLCVYDREVTPSCAVAGLERSHQRLWGPDGALRKRATDRDLGLLGAAEPPLEPPAQPIEELPMTPDLHRMRRQIERSAAASGLTRAQRQDFVLAVNEAAANALEYDEPPRALRLWRRDAAVIGEVVGRGRIEDPLAGRRRPAPTAVRGRGLWIVNQLCDLVELRSCQSRTTLRMHMRCEGA